ncbi:DUF1361 domain-containing protein [bacterium]|nr:DUF1361 domain-containing protein [bacterium]
MTIDVTHLIQRTTAKLRQLREQLCNRYPAVAPTHWNPLATLALASAAACGLWALRVVIQERLHHAFLPWNLFLAWLPMAFSLLTIQLSYRHGWRSWKPWLAAGLWLLFFPNAPYIFTDLTHLGPTINHRFWMDLIMILLFAWPGFLVGCLSLRILHHAVADRLGAVAGWGFVSVACGLAGVGVYIGRFLRWNSWDVITHPFGLWYDLLGFFGHPTTHPAYRFSLVFGILLFVGYVTLHSLSTTPPSRQSACSTTD